MSYNIEEIKKQFCDVLAYAQGFENPKVDELFMDWEINKQRFIKLFGDNLIYEFPQEVNFTLSEEEKNKLVEKFLYDLRYYDNFSALEDFLLQNESTFFDNVVSKEFEYKGQKITTGTKLLKAFKYFIKDKDNLRELQDQASEIIQKNKLHGKLCVSIHPLDYLSISENAQNWRSCHALNGDYAAGNLAYMSDSATIVAYIKSKEDKILPHFPFKWNSKKWRVLMFVGEANDVVWFGRQYPFALKQGMLTLKNLFIEGMLTPLNEHKRPEFFSWSPLVSPVFDKLTYNHIDENTGEVMPTSSGVFPKRLILNNMKNKLEPLENYIHDASGRILYYNDLLESPYYKPYYTSYSFFTNDTTPRAISIGGDILCPECGVRYIEFGDSMRCSFCHEEDNRIECDCCGELFHENDIFYTDIGTRVCANCLDEYYGTCRCCGEVLPLEYLQFDEESEEFICKECFEEEGEE